MYQRGRILPRAPLTAVAVLPWVSPAGYGRIQQTLWHSGDASWVHRAPRELPGLGNHIPSWVTPADSEIPVMPEMLNLRLPATQLVMPGTQKGAIPPRTPAHSQRDPWGPAGPAPPHHGGKVLNPLTGRASKEAGMNPGSIPTRALQQVLTQKKKKKF